MSLANMDKKQLSTFRRYQSVLAESLKDELMADHIDLYEICHSYIIFDDDAKLSIQYIPFEGDYVYMTYSHEKVDDNVKFNVDNLSLVLLDELIEMLRKCMIIVELRVESRECENRRGLSSQS